MARVLAYLETISLFLLLAPPTIPYFIPLSFTTLRSVNRCASLTARKIGYGAANTLALLDGRILILRFLYVEINHT